MHKPGSRRIFTLLFLGVFTPFLLSAKGMDMKKAVMVIASENFRDEELFGVRQALESNNITVEVACSTLDEARGMLGGRAKPDMLISDIDMIDLDAVIFVGGQGATQYYNDMQVRTLLQDAVNQNKVIGAICLAPVILAKAGILRGRRATVYPSEQGQLTENGADYTGRAVEVDGKIITANGPTASSEFAQELVQAINFGR